MKCPACNAELAELTQSDLTVDVCDKGCGGIWFDNRELKKVDEAHESRGEVLLDISPHKPVPVDYSARRACPKCADATMQRHFFSIRREIEVDTCPGCGGAWLDAGELASIRSQFKTEQERKKAADEYFSKLFGEQLEQEAKKGEAALEGAKKVANALRFVCPSYWIPGKQRWGAF